MKTRIKLILVALVFYWVTASAQVEFGGVSRSALQSQLSLGWVRDASPSPATVRLINSTDYVGIGVNLPKRPLHIHTTTSFPSLQITNGTTGIAFDDGAILGPDGLNLRLLNQENANLELWTNNILRFGIGPSNLSWFPSGAKLVVGGNSSDAAANVVAVNSGGLSGITAVDGVANASSVGIVVEPLLDRVFVASGATGSGTQRPLGFVVNNAERWVIDTNGMLSSGVALPAMDRIHMDFGSGNGGLRLTNTATGIGSGDGGRLANLGLILDLINLETAQLRLGTAGIIRMVVEGNGDVTFKRNGTNTDHVIGVMSIQSGGSKTLVDETGNSFVQIACAVGEFVGGELFYSAKATDGTDYQCRSGSISFSAVNKTGTPILSFGTPSESVITSVGTLTILFDENNTAGNVNLQVEPNSSLASPTITFTYKIILTSGTAVITTL